MTTPTNPSYGSPKTQTSNGPSTATEMSDSLVDALDRGKSGLTESANAAGSDLAEDMRNLRSDVAKMQQTISKFTSEVGAQTSRTASEVGSTVADQVSSAANDCKGGAEIAAYATPKPKPRPSLKTWRERSARNARRHPLGRRGDRPDNAGESQLMLTAIMRLFGIDLEHQILVLKEQVRELVEEGTSRARHEINDATFTAVLVACSATAASATVAVGLAALFLWVDRDHGTMLALSAVAGVTAVIALLTFTVAWKRSRKVGFRSNQQPAVQRPAVATPPVPRPLQPAPVDLSTLVPPPPPNATIVDLLTHRFAHRVAAASDEAMDTATGLVRDGSREALFGTLALAAVVGVLIGRRRVQH